jgi:hypothetical protein
MSDHHISDQELLLHADGELSAVRSSQIRDHLASCWSCRTRKAAFEQAIEDFVRVHYLKFDAAIPPIDGSRALLRSRLAAAAATVQPPSRRYPALAWAGAALLLIGLFAWFQITARTILNLNPAYPNMTWTPGAAGSMNRQAVCSAEQSDGGHALDKSKADAVFRRYGIRSPHPRSYEVDYLIPRSLGGSDDISNLWPEPYSAGVWNSHVKDALEERLRTMVCDGQLDLATAQRDISRDWIAAYKKYFHTDRPLLDHVAFVKDSPWE